MKKVKTNTLQYERSIIITTFKVYSKFIFKCLLIFLNGDKDAFQIKKNC